MSVYVFIDRYIYIISIYPWVITTINCGLVIPIPTPEICRLHLFPIAAITNKAT